MCPARYSGVYQSSVRCSLIIFKQMKRQLTSYWRSCLTSVIQREVIQAHGQTGSRKNSRSAMPSRLPVSSVPLTISRPSIGHHELQASFDVPELRREAGAERRTCLGHADQPQPEDDFPGGDEGVEVLKLVLWQGAVLRVALDKRIFEPRVVVAVAELPERDRDVVDPIAESAI